MRFFSDIQNYHSVDEHTPGEKSLIFLIVNDLPLTGDGS